jgi:predicted nucleotidyltransferase
MKPLKPIKRKLVPVQRDALSEALAGLVRQLVPDAAAVYVFGSFARGEDFADIDVGILMGGAVAGPLELELKLEVSLEKDLNYPVDVRFLDGAPLSFQFAVVRDGRAIVDSEPNRRAAFEGLVRKKYFDFAIFRKRYLKEAAHAGV